MSIPIDKLYHYIEGIAKKIRGDDIVIYRFYPHGSKNLNDLTLLKDSSILEALKSIPIVCYDQEPLNYKIYCDQNKDLKYQWMPNTNLLKFPTIYDAGILIHSEQRSPEVQLYNNNQFLSVYYWSHAIISRDWFRYAVHEKINKNINKTFLIYNRAWSGTREYRLKFVELLIKNNLIANSLTTFNPIDSELKYFYTEHNFINSKFNLTQSLENHLPLNTAEATASADYVIEDYNATEFEVVLETLFDDSRLHLTEKVLRPIALGQPFLLAATRGSLEYLRSYGFRTFATVIDESYDTIEDPMERLEAIVRAMKEIASWTEAERAEKMAIANRIAKYNCKHFFSNKFLTQVTDELHNNLKDRLLELENSNRSNRFINCGKFDLPHDIAPQDLAKILSKARKYYNKH